MFPYWVGGKAMICTTVPADAVVAGTRLRPAVMMARDSVVLWMTQHLIDTAVAEGVTVVLHMMGWAALGFTGVVTMVGGAESDVAHVTEQVPLLSRVQFAARVIRGGMASPRRKVMALPAAPPTVSGVATVAAGDGIWLCRAERSA